MTDTTYPITDHWIDEHGDWFYLGGHVCDDDCQPGCALDAPSFGNVVIDGSTGKFRHTDARISDLCPLEPSDPRAMAVARHVMANPGKYGALILLAAAGIISEPVGMSEIAQRLGVRRNTVDSWKQRDILPKPWWLVGGRPGWPWPVIEQWARETGRLARLS